MSAELTLPPVHLTQLLRQALLDDGLDPDDFAQYFAEWKAMGAAGEYLDYYFGKDGDYDQPRRGGQRVLRHVHMPPEDRRADESEPPSPALAQWERDWQRRRRKTSDTALIYAHDPRRGYLLIYLAREPTGHQIAQMTTETSRTFMNQLADVADAFITHGRILI